MMQHPALFARHRQQQLMNGMAVSNAGGMAGFQGPNGGAPQMRTPLPGGMYTAAGPGGMPGAGMTAFAGNPQLRGMLPPQVQQQLQQQQHQQQQIQAAQQYTMATQVAAQGNAHAAAMNMPQQGQQMSMNALQAQQQQAAAMVAHRAAQQYVSWFLLY